MIDIRLHSAPDVSRRAVLRGIGAGVLGGIATGCAGRSGEQLALPLDPQATATPDLVDLVRFDPRLRLDIRYATPANFMGRKLYPLARAVAQRPVAEALAKVQTRAEAAGYGLLIFDAYRPWRITKAMWEATPPEKREFVADPAVGSRHNRGCSIDLSLHRNGVEVVMPSPYDDFTPAAYRSNTAAPPEALALSRMLEGWMVAEGFVPLPNEWWHYDWAEWRRYPIMDVPLEDVTAG
ncbi:MAG: M15 family metallopeptidase [Erythrobacter sp.]|jgi:D-alanyl-D-alanine dipeptidase|uniref:M15 family metallopeptidase n=1 Tax=Erythrobacter sp. TaxID=1042 RepID=UPI002B49AC72|nr:M15 family metallopeptidase [Erythrobacter sp.]WRH71393.1 MAG: M15 family metallopeptidase [Erythrobacter sp.]